MPPKNRRRFDEISLEDDDGNEIRLVHKRRKTAFSFLSRDTLENVLSVGLPMAIRKGRQGPHIISHITTSVYISILNHIKFDPRTIRLRSRTLLSPGQELTIAISKLSSRLASNPLQTRSQIVHYISRLMSLQRGLREAKTVEEALLFYSHIVEFSMLQTRGIEIDPTKEDMDGKAEDRIKALHDLNLAGEIRKGLVRRPDRNVFQTVDVGKEHLYVGLGTLSSAEQRRYLSSLGNRYPELEGKKLGQMYHFASRGTSTVSDATVGSTRNSVYDEAEQHSNMNFRRSTSGVLKGLNSFR